MNALNGVVSGHLNEGLKNFLSEFSRLVNSTRHTLATYVLNCFDSGGFALLKWCPGTT